MISLKIFFVLDEELKMIFSANTKACTGLQYSDGGHLLAAGTFFLQKRNFFFYMFIMYLLSQIQT